MDTEVAEDGARKRARSREPETQSNGAGSSPMRQIYARDNQGPSPHKRVACTHCRQSKVCSNAFSVDIFIFRGLNG
jgi:hypothetical protein